MLTAVIFLTLIVLGKTALVPSEHFSDVDNIEETRYLFVKRNGKYEVEDLLNSKIQLQAGPKDVSIYFYNKEHIQNPLLITVNDVDKLEASGRYNPKLKNVFITHGWNNNHSSPVNSLIKEALLAKHEVNLFVIDWMGPASKNYVTAQSAVKPIGEAVASFINSMLTKFNITASAFNLFGHSLGAHISGNAGAAINGQVDVIVGLDPAKPLFFDLITSNRLDTSDATFVEIIHSCGRELGFASSIGHLDYYPNGGMIQPGCGLDLTGTCSHSRAYEFFAESIRNNTFVATQCDSYRHFQKGKCSSESKSLMGGYPVNVNATGTFYLETNSEEPFGRG